MLADAEAPGRDCRLGGCPIYFWQGCLPDAHDALYFSAVTYTTVGYGNIVLPRLWRIFAPIEALTGILMWGISTGLFVAIVSRWISKWTQGKTAPKDHSAAPLKK